MTTLGTTGLVVGLLCLFLGALLVLVIAQGGFAANDRGMDKTLSLVDSMAGSATSTTGQDPETGFKDRVWEPLLGRSLALGRRLTPADHGDRIRTKLAKAGSPEGLTVDRVTSMKVIGLFAFLTVSLLLTRLMGLSFPVTLVLVVGATVIGYQAVDLYLYQLAYDRGHKLQRELADAIDLLTISVESGLGFDAALAQVARNTDGPIGEEFARVLHEMQIGNGRSASLRAMAERVDADDVRSFVSAMVQADAFGIPIGNVLRVQSKEIRVKRRQAAEEAAQKVPVKIMVPLIFCVLPCLFIVVLGPAGISIMDSFGGM
ncbi:type II secretion system F family protein [Nocardioidaceae bacterium]|nr:type II secretion system F family protein [Nocardioidaceae bacterium]